MEVVLFMSIFWIVYGIAGLLGYQRIANKFKGKSWTKDYIRKQGLSWIILGIPWLVCYFALQSRKLDLTYEILILIACSILSLVYTIVTDKKYNDLLKEDVNL